MLDKIELSRPVAIDGEQVRELTYDIDAITGEQFVEAETRTASAAMRLGKISSKPAELDAGFHYYLGIMAVIAANPTYAVEDVERVSGRDIVKIMRVGRVFTTADAEAEGDEDSAAAEETENGGESFPETRDYAEES